MTALSVKVLLRDKFDGREVGEDAERRLWTRPKGGAWVRCWNVSAQPDGRLVVDTGASNG